MSEITSEPVHLSEGESFTADGDAIVFTERHSHRDILRYVIAELGEETMLHVAELLHEAKGA